MRERVYAALRKHDEAGQDPILVAKSCDEDNRNGKTKATLPGGKGRTVLGGEYALSQEDTPAVDG